MGGETTGAKMMSHIYVTKEEDEKAKAVAREQMQKRMDEPDFARSLVGRDRFAEINSRITTLEAEKRALANRLSELERQMACVAKFCTGDGVFYNRHHLADDLTAKPAAEEIRVVKRPGGKFDVVKGNLWYFDPQNTWEEDASSSQCGCYKSEDIALAVASALRAREAKR
jgi:hypothetical protein